MTRKQCQILANAIRFEIKMAKAHELRALSLCAIGIAGALGREYCGFLTGRFLRACGLTEDHETGEWSVPERSETS